MPFRWLGFISKPEESLEERFYLHKHLCLNVRTNKLICQRCEQVCPVKSIKLEKDNILIDDCKKCGLCAVACPSGVFDELWNAFYQVINVVKDSRPDIWVTCHNTRAVKSGLQLNCLGELTSELVFYMLQKGIGRVQVLYEPDTCRECMYNSGQKVWEENLQQLSRIYPAETQLFNLYEDAAMIKESQDSEVDFSRRSLLRNWAANTQQLIGELIPGPSANYSPHPWEQNLSLRRKLFVYMLNNLDREKTAEIQLGHLRHPEINKDCSFCGSCAKLCPSGAMKLEEAINKEITLLVNADECNMCGLCAAICPADAITADQKLNNAQLSRQVILVKGTSYHCRKCSLEYYDHLGLEELICPDCKNSHFNYEMLWPEY